MLVYNVMVGYWCMCLSEVYNINLERNTNITLNLFCFFRGIFGKKSTHCVLNIESLKFFLMMVKKNKPNIHI